jgi:DNA processing protein
MNNLRYWIWFTQSIGYCTTKAKQLTFLYDSIEEFYLGGENEWRLSGLFSNKEIENMTKTPLSVADEIINKCNHYFYDLVCIDSPEYPECLFEIDDPPAVLYISGALPDIDDRMSIAVIGTRKASMYGIKSSYSFAYNLAKSGVTIISGGALGVDCSSHLGALAADGVTICVLGCGINYDYLRENAKMRSDITYKGAVISEYPPDTEPYSYHFPQRNRIISALSDGVLVIEAGSRSGSLITVNSALEQNPNKKIFALAGPVDSHFDGSNKLVKNKIATLVTDYKDIIDAFENVYVTTELEVSAQPSDDVIDVIPIKGKAPKDINGLRTNDLSEIPLHKENLNLSDDENKVYYAISYEPIHIDKIAEITNLPVFKILPILTTLELRELIKCVQGRSYKII